MQGRNSSLPRESVLKVDKDCHIDSALEHEYIQNSLAVLSRRGITVLKIEATRTYHGSHYYFYLAETIDAQTANSLQYLLGDDSKRVDYNRARINSELTGWNKLFETVGRKTLTLYQRPSCGRNRSKSQKRRSPKMDELAKVAIKCAKLQGARNIEDVENKDSLLLISIATDQPIQKFGNKHIVIDDDKAYVYEEK
jgi:hypothetical protein